MFSLFENLKKIFLEEWKTFENHFFESHTFNLLKEKYQSLSLFRQNLIKYGCFLFLFFLLIYLPASYFFSSGTYWSDFKEQQELSMELSKMRKKISTSLFRFSQQRLKGNIESSIGKYSNDDFKIKEKKIPLSEKSIYQVDFDIQVKHINIKQVFRLGTELNTLSQSRLKSIAMEENPKYPKHYDVIYVLSSFFVKERPSSLKRQRERVEPRKRRRDRSRSRRSPRKRPEVLEKSNPILPKEIKQNEESKRENLDKETRDKRERRERRETEGKKEIKEIREIREIRENRENKEEKETREIKGNQENKETNNKSPKDKKFLIER